MNGSLKINTSLSHPAIPSSRYLEDALHALLEIKPEVSISTGSRPALNIVLVVDASASMHHFQLTDEEREYWMGVAISRDELDRGEADESDAMYWTGQTLSEMQTLANTPMAFATEAIKNLLLTLRPTDQIAVIAFADHTHTVFNQQDWANFPDGCLTQMDMLQERRLPVDIGNRYLHGRCFASGTAVSESKHAGPRHQPLNCDFRRHCSGPGRNIQSN